MSLDNNTAIYLGNYLTKYKIYGLSARNFEQLELSSSQNQVSYFTAEQGFLQGNLYFARLQYCFTCQLETSNKNFRKKNGKTGKNDNDNFSALVFKLAKLSLNTKFAKISTCEIFER